MDCCKNTGFQNLMLWDCIRLPSNNHVTHIYILWIRPLTAHAITQKTHSFHLLDTRCILGHIYGRYWKLATQLIENAHYDPITRLQIRIFSAISFGHSQQLRHSLMPGPRANVTVADCSCSISFNDNDFKLWLVCSVHALQWRHDEHDGVANHQRLECLLNRLFRCRSRKISKLLFTGPLSGEFTGHRWIPLTKVQ